MVLAPLPGPRSLFSLYPSILHCSSDDCGYSPPLHGTSIRQLLCVVKVFFPQLEISLLSPPLEWRWCVANDAPLILFFLFFLGGDSSFPPHFEFFFFSVTKSSFLFFVMGLPDPLVVTPFPPILRGFVSPICPRAALPFPILPYSKLGCLVFLQLPNRSFSNAFPPPTERKVSLPPPRSFFGHVQPPFCLVFGQISQSPFFPLFVLVFCNFVGCHKLSALVLPRFHTTQTFHTTSMVTIPSSFNGQGRSRFFLPPVPLTGWPTPWPSLKRLFPK